MSQLTQQIHSSEIGDILENSLNGIRPKKEDYLRLLKSDDVYLMGLVAGNITRKKFGKKVSFVNNIILNYTNIGLEIQLVGGLMEKYLILDLLIVVCQLNYRSTIKDRL